MAAWGLSWGLAWGSAWGGAAPTPAPVPDVVVVDGQVTATSPWLYAGNVSDLLALSFLDGVPVLATTGDHTLGSVAAPGIEVVFSRANDSAIRHAVVDSSEISVVVESAGIAATAAAPRSVEFVVGP